MYAKNAWEKYSDSLDEVMTFNEDYKRYISLNKTERACVKDSIAMAEKAGFRDLDSYDTLKAGDKVYVNNKGKNLALFIIGEKPIAEGMRILGAHIDSPRLDLKQNPLYEAEGYALLDTHYYGGIKKYQWVTIPLSLYGVVAKKDGTVIDVVIVKLLKEKYDIDEEDFLSAEIEVVPSGKARDYGLDRSMVAGYGHDDRVCAYTSLRAILDSDTPVYTSCTILVDKEEIGSVGATGAHSLFFENTVAKLLAKMGCDSFVKTRAAMANSKMLSSDVSAGVDPLFVSVNDKKNAAYLGHGIVFNKYTGARGKSGSNDASAEYMAHIRGVMDDGGIYFQSAELGKVDQGGGGTIAYILGNYDMEVIDAGIAVLNMHAPMEVVSKVDVYETYQAYKVFLKNA